MASLLLLGLSLAAAGGCAGLPGPQKAPDNVEVEPPEQAEILMFQQGAWLSPDLFSPDHPGGARGRVAESPWMTFNVSADTEIGRPHVTMELGTDSSRIPMMPSHGCFEGLVPEDLVPLTAAGPPERGCRERGYGRFVRCPGDPAGRLPVYLAAWALHDRRGKLLQRRRLLTAAEVAHGRKGPRPISLICAKERRATVIPVPARMHVDGRVRLRLRIKLVVDARRADPNLRQVTYLRMQAVNR